MFGTPLFGPDEWSEFMGSWQSQVLVVFNNLTHDERRELWEIWHQEKYDVDKLCTMMTKIFLEREND